MIKKKRGLGRPLGAILSAATLTDSSPAMNTPSNPFADGQILKLPVEYLQSGRYQPRHDFDPEALEQLAASIRAEGIIQPIVARQLDNEKHYEIIAGERRWRAAKSIGMNQVPVIVRNFSDSSAMAVSLIENIQREDLNPIEEANALQRLLEEFGMTHKQVASAVGRSRTTVSNLLRLLALDKHVSLFLERGDLEMGHARALLSLTHDNQRKAAEQIIARNLTVRETEKLVKQFGEINVTHQKPSTTPIVGSQQEKLGRVLNTKVTIQQNERGQGKIVIFFNNAEKLQNLIEQID
jgi:ParB family chromosome partitioning protein